MPLKMKNGKSYLTVVERMNLLLEEKGKEDYSLETSVKYDSGIMIIKATLTLFYCYPEDETDTVQVVSRKYCGHALGEVGKHKTLEATETHAIGRALASAGWFGDEFASANEMESWEQSKPKKKSINLNDLKEGNPKAKENAKKLEEPIDEFNNLDEIVESGVGVKVVDDIKLTFGANKGKMVSECDVKYLKWLSTSDLDFMKDDDGGLQVDRIKAFNDCAKYFHYHKIGKEAVTF